MVNYIGNLKLGIILSGLIWLFGLIYGTIVFEIIGVDYMADDFEFYSDHSKYWEFESILLPSFIIVGLLIMAYYFKKSEIEKTVWKKEGLSIGILMMVIQFVMDLILFIVLLGDEFRYFYGMVTISYLTIPGWGYISAWYWKERKG